MTRPNLDLRLPPKGKWHWLIKAILILIDSGALSWTAVHGVYMHRSNQTVIDFDYN